MTICGSLKPRRPGDEVIFCGLPVGHEGPHSSIVPKNKTEWKDYKVGDE